MRTWFVAHRPSLFRAFLRRLIEYKKYGDQHYFFNIDLVPRRPGDLSIQRLPATLIIVKPNKKELTYLEGFVLQDSPGSVSVCSANLIFETITLLQWHLGHQHLILSASSSEMIN